MKEEDKERFDVMLDTPDDGPGARKRKKEPTKAELDKDAQSFMSFMASANVGP